MKKFELTGEFVTNFFGKKLFRIRALVAFGDVEAGELGGYVEKEENLDQYGNAWVSGNARVSGNALVSGDALVSGNARVYGNARVSGNARVYGNARVSGDAWVSGDALVSGNADILHITGLGTVHRTTTAFKTDLGIMVSCGCFFGNIEEFRKQVINTREGKVRLEYLAFADLLEIYFGKEE